MIFHKKHCSISRSDRSVHLPKSRYFNALNKESVILITMMMLVSSFVVAPGLAKTQTAPTGFQGGANYLSSSNQFYQNDSVTSADFAYFKANNVTRLSVRIFWKNVAYANGTFNAAVLKNYERLLTVAQQYGMKVQLDFWTQFGSSWSNPPFINSIYDIIRNSTVRNLWFKFINYTVTQLKSYPAITSYTMMNEPYVQKSEDASLFYQTWQQQYALMKKIDPSRPLSIRFALGESPWSYAFSQTQVFKVCDYIAINEYLDPSNSSSTRYGATWTMFNRAVTACKNARKSLWISEFGTDSGTPQARQTFYQKSLALFRSKGIRVAFAFAWLSITPQTQAFNIATGIAAGTPAFYELGKISH